MKKFLILLSCLSSAVFSQWYPQNSSAGTLYDCFFLNSSTGYAVGEDGVILKTTDGGLNWVKKNSGTTGRLYGVHFMSESTGIVVGGASDSYSLTSILLKTTDSGETWLPRTSHTSNWLTSVSFCDANNGYICGDGGTILRTANGGETWIVKNSGSSKYLRSISTVFPWLCYAVGWDNTILKTTTGGTSWITQNCPAHSYLEGVRFLNANLGFAVGDRGMIFKTTNGGSTWNQLNSGTDKSLLSVFIINSDQIVVTGTGGLILRSENGGSKWYVQSILSESEWWNNYYSVYFTSPDIGTVVGYNILKTTNGGYPMLPVVYISFPNWDEQCYEDCISIPKGWFFTARGLSSAKPSTFVNLVQIKIDNQPWHDVLPDGNGSYDNWSHPVDISMLPYPYAWHRHTIYARSRDNLNHWSDIDSNIFVTGHPAFPKYGEEIAADIQNKMDSVFIPKGTEFYVDIDLDNWENPNLQYVSFELRYTHPELLEYLSDLITISTADKTVIPEPEKGKISFAVYNNPDLCDGCWLADEILKVKFRLKSDAPLDQYIVFYFTNEYPLTGWYTRMFITDKITQWPGDANNNGKVEITDINNIVNYWNKTGTELQGMNSWTGYTRSVWDEYPMATFADGDGNGLVNIKDIDPILTYLGYEHSPYSVSAPFNTAQSPPISIDGPVAVSKGQEIFYDISLGNEEKSLDELKVVSFELLYDKDKLRYIDNETGQFLPQSTVVNEQDKGRLSVSVYNLKEGASGYGNIIRFKFLVKDKTDVELKFQNLLANRRDGSVQPLLPLDFNTTVEVGKPDVIPSGYCLNQNFPNPFNAATIIKYQLPEDGLVKLKVYNSLGEEIFTAVNREEKAGLHEVTFNAINLPSGIYIYKLQAGGFTSVKKMVLLK